MKKVYLLILFGLISLSFFSCNGDEGIDNTGNGDSTNKPTNEWIEETMRANYFWYKEIPEKSMLNFNSDPEAFFTSLLSNKDGYNPSASGGHRYFSNIEKKANSTRSSLASGKMSLGFEFMIYYFTIQQINVVQIIYVLPNSPASRNNLKRGDWIFTINDQPISMPLIETLMTSNSVKLGVSESTASTNLKSITLNAQSIEANPVFVDTTYYHNGGKIGYLVYNQFESGPDENNPANQTYDNTMRKAFSKFKSEMPDDFILDLRYNSGGLVSCAQLLATMLAPESALNDVFCKLTYNDKLSPSSYTFKFDPQIIKQNGYGENINLKRLFVITSKRTASASEAVINGLKPFLGNNIILVGDKTLGKNMGSLPYTDARFDWELHPIVCQISNKKNESDYSNGFVPTADCLEPDIKPYNLGDINEYILNEVLAYITEGKPIQNIHARNTRSSDSNMTLVGSSLDRKTKNGMTVPRPNE